MSTAGRAIYADHAATTPVRGEVVDLMTLILREEFANPSSANYEPGRIARSRINTAREQVAKAIGADAAQITFTSGSTESCNLAIIGTMQRILGERPKMVAISTEHPCVHEPMKAVAAAGGEYVTVPVGPHGRPDLKTLESSIDERTGLVAAMLVNNETGVVNDVAAISEIAHQHGALMLCDATQGIGRLEVDVNELGCDFLAYTGHKIYGPKGSGCLWRRRGLALNPLFHGGGQEQALRPGTENVAGIAGFGLAAEMISHNVAANREHLGKLTEQLEGELSSALPGLRIHGAATERAPGSTFITLPGLPRGWLAQCSQICCSGGSSCHSGSSHGATTLLAMGIAESEAANAIRITLGLGTTIEEVGMIAAAVIAGAQRLQQQDQ